MIQSLGQVMSSATALARGRGDYTPSEVSQWANIAIQEVSQKIGHRSMELIAVSSTTSGENRYSTPPDFDAVVALTLYQGSNSTNTISRSTVAVPLAARSANWADARSLPDYGVPEQYVTYDGFFELYPSPNSSYSLQMRYFGKHPTLVQSSETILLDDRWHPAVTFKTAEYLCGIRNDVEGEAMARNRYLNYLSTVPNDRQLAQRNPAAMYLRFTRTKPREQ